MTYDDVRDEVHGGDAASFDVLAWGDVDGDGDDDAVALTVWCDIACGNHLDLILNDDGTPWRYTGYDYAAFEPWFIASGTRQSSQLGAQINGSTVVLTGLGLCGEVPEEMYPDSPCGPDLFRTATYRWVDGALVAISIDPEVM